MKKFVCKAKVVLVGGSSSRTMAYKTCKLCAEAPHVVILPTARGDDPEIIEETVGFYSQFARSVDVLKLVKETPSREDVRRRIQAADLIYVPGGAMEPLMKRWSEYDAQRWILEAAATEGKVLVGSSAGAMAFSHTGFEDYDGEYFVDGYDIVPVWFSPHYQMEEWKRFDSFLTQKTKPRLAFAAGDDAGVQYYNGRYSAFFGEEGNSVWRFVLNDESGLWDRIEYPADEDKDITPDGY